MLKSLLAALLIGFAAAGAAAGPDAVTADGGRYYGPLVGGKLQGKGRIEWGNGTFYEGGFANGLLSGAGHYHFADGADYQGEMREGMFWGKGTLRYGDGRTYQGDFVRSQMQGKGRFEAVDGEVYEGDFVRDAFTGKGRYTRKDGGRYEGEFRNFVFEGAGRLTDASGNVWEGTFKNGQLEGPGRSSSPRGKYEGEFKRWSYHGKGVLRLPNGDVYDGSFAYGQYEGPGTLTYATPRADGRTKDSGIWHYGRLANDPDEARMRANVEAALYAQRRLLDGALAALKPREPGRVNLYLLAVAGDGSQEVFRREVDYVQKEFAERFGTRGRTVALVNSRNTVASVPMATVASVREALKAIAARMDPEEDVLFLYMTSHGSPGEFYINQKGMDLPKLGAATLGRLLKESGIRWKVVVVSACYSGGFIAPLQDGSSLVITAAREDRRSFGCADENDFTNFGRAYFKESLPTSGSFEEAFGKAERLVEQWEARDHEDRSYPQISTSPAVQAHLKLWWRQVSSRRGE